MADVDEGRPGRQLASNLRELMKQVDIRTGTDRDKERERDADWASESQASVRDIFARRRAAIPAPSVSSTSSRPAPRRLSIGSEVSSAPTAMYTPGRRIDELSDDGSTVDTPIARAPAQPLPSSAASLHALRARLENPSEQDTASDLTGWDRSARSLMTTRGQASSSRLHVYDDGSNLLDEDLGAVPSLAISHVDSTLQFQPSVGNTSRTPVAPRQRPHVIPKGPSLQSASLAERLAGIPDDGLEFDDTDREDFDRNRMDDDSDDLLHQENDLLRSSSPPPPDSPMKPSPVLRHARHLSTGQPLSGSWENVMAEGSVMSLPNVDERPGRKSGPANASGSGSGSRLMQAINDGEESYQRSLQENSQGSSQDDPSRTSPDKSGDPAPRSGNTTAKSRLSTIGRSRLPLAKPATPQSQPKAGVSEISFPRPASPSGPPPKRDSPGRPTSRLGEPASRLPRPTSPSPSIAASESGAPDSPERPRRHSQVPVTPSRIPRVSMSASHTGSPGESPSRPAGPRSSTSLGMAPTSTPPRAVSSLGMNGPSTTPSRRLTPARSTSSLGHHQTPPETDVDRERNWGKALPKLTHANLRMRHESMESSVHSYLGGLSPSRGGSVAGRPTTPSFVGYARKEGSEVSSSQGSAGSDEDANLRRSRKMSVASAQGTKSGRELRGPSSITSPTASSLARSSGPGLARHSSLKTPSKPGAGMMRHSASFTGSPSASSFRGSDRGASPINSPRKVTARHSTEFVGVKDYERVRERDWGRPTGSRAIGVANVRPRVVSGGSPGGVGKSPGLGRNRVVSGGSAGGSERPESPLARTRTSGVRPRPHTIHFGAHSTPNLEELGQREPLDGGEEFLERDDEDMSSQNESVLEWRRQQQVEDLEEETEVEEERPSSPSPPSPSRSIPLPPSPPPVVVPRVQLHPPREPDPPTEASVSLFRDGPTNGEITPAAESTTRVSLGQERDHVPSIPDEAPPSETYSPKRRSFAQPESPTISFMDTLPALPDPPSDEEISVVVPPVRPSVNTRLNVLAREPSPGSASASEKTPRASTISLRAPSPGISRTPTPPEPETQAPPNVASGLKLSGVEPVAQSRALVDPEKLEVPRASRSRSRSNTLGTSLPRVEVNTAITRDELDSAATPVATRWMEQAAMRRERTLLGGEKTVLASENTRVTETRPSSSAGPVLLKPSPPVSKAPSPLGAHAPALPASSAPPLQARHSDPQLPPMMSQKGKEILERIQRQAATLARDLETERQVVSIRQQGFSNIFPIFSSLPVPQGDEVQVETDQIVKLSTTARAERERLEKLRVARNAAKEEKVAVQVVPARRRSLSWIFFSILMTALCAWLALYALSHHATNVYLDPLYPVLYGGDVNPLRHARTIDTFPSSWNSYLVPKPGIQHWVSMHLTPLSQKLWAIPGQAVQHLMSSWPPS